MAKRESADIEYSFIKGKIGEAIVRRMFDALGMHVCHYGYEFITPSLMLLGRKKELANKSLNALKNHPDFLVCDLSKDDHKTRKLYKIEVKYRSNGCINFKELLKYENDVHFLFIDNTEFWAASYDEIQKLSKDLDGGSFSFHKVSKLEEYAGFDLSAKQKDIICAYKKFIEITFGQLPQHQDGINKIKEGCENIWKKIDAQYEKNMHPEVEEYVNSDEPSQCHDINKSKITDMAAKSDGGKKGKAQVKNWPLIRRINENRVKKKKSGS